MSVYSARRPRQHPEVPENQHIQVHGLTITISDFIVYRVGQHENRRSCDVPT